MSGKEPNVFVHHICFVKKNERTYKVHMATGKTPNDALIISNKIPH